MSALIAFINFVLNIIIFTALGSQSKAHSALFLVALIAFWILYSGHRRQLSKRARVHREERGLNKEGERTVKDVMEWLGFFKKKGDKSKMTLQNMEKLIRKAAVELGPEKVWKIRCQGP